MGNRRFAMARRWTTLLLVAGIGLVGSASATLIVEPDGVVLDTNTGLEWEQNANHGPFNWAGAVNYANTLTLDGGGWHLAAIGELQGLYNDLIAAGVCLGDFCAFDRGGFTDIQNAYWSSTEVVPGAFALKFSFAHGFQDFDFEKFVELPAWAVRPGDVDAAAPEPASLLLVGAGMLGLGWARRRGRRR